MRRRRQEVLTKAGYTWKSVVDGREAWFTLDREPLSEPARFGALVMDWHLDFINGDELLRRIFADSRFIDLRIVIFAEELCPSVFAAIPVERRCDIQRWRDIEHLPFRLDRLLHDYPVRQEGNTLPAHQRAPVVSTLDGGGEKARFRMLLVDDAKLVRFVYSRLLEQAGYQVATAEDGDDAVATLRAFQPHMVISDYNLPDSNGCELTRRILRDNVATVTIVAILSSEDSVAIAQESMQAGAIDVLSKNDPSSVFLTRVGALARLALIGNKAKELAEVNQRLSQTQAQLVQAGKLSSLGQLATGMAHEINQPLNYIKGTLSHLRRRRADMLEESGLLSYVKESSRQVDRVAALVDHLRTFGRDQAENWEPVGLEAVIGQSMLLFSERLRLANIEVDVDVSPDNLEIVANHSQIEQVLINLLQNAADAVASRPANERLILVTAEPAKDSRDGRSRGIWLKVADRGVGMDDATMVQIFDPFFTTKEVGKGTGLGMSLVFAIVDGHRGYLDCGSKLGKGTEICVFLPNDPRDSRGSA